MGLVRGGSFIGTSLASRWGTCRLQGWEEQETQRPDAPEDPGPDGEMCLWPDRSPFVKPAPRHPLSRNSSVVEGGHVHRAICYGGVRNKSHHWSLQHLTSELFSRALRAP